MAPTESLNAIRRFWQRSYAADYIGFALLLVAFGLLRLLTEPFHRMFSLDDRAIQFPHAEVERVSVGWLFIYAGVVPLGALSLWAVLLRPGWHKAHVALLGLLVSLILTAFLTDVVKNAVGRPRPDLLARCKPRGDAPHDRLVTIDVCTETDHHTLHDGWRSFPSGHSSFAFSGLGYIALMLAGQLHVCRPPTDLTRALLVLVPLVGALLIAISRCEDYRHDVYDVTVGSILGLSVAYVTYRRYFPALKAARCDEPFSAGLDASANAKLRDEEEGPEAANQRFRESERIPLNQRE